MLKIYFGEKHGVMKGPSWFKFNYREEWLDDPFVHEMMIDIDKSEYVGGQLIKSEVLGPIPPERLSGGLKTLISIYKNPDLIFDATSCGENCAKWLAEIGKKEDVEVVLHYFMPFYDNEPFEFYIVNDDTLVTNMKEYTKHALKYI